MKKVKKKIASLAEYVVGPNRILEKRFEYHHGYSINIKSPQTFSEKIQWLKLYGGLENYGHVVDKYEARLYIKNIVGEEYLIPLLGVYTKSEEIDYSVLPTSFIMKATHGSGWNILVRDKSKENFKHINRRLDKWLNTNYFKISKESNYKNIKPRIVIEEIIENSLGKQEEYKFFCFNGNVEFVQYDEYINGIRYRNIYTTNWEKKEIVFKYPHIPNNVKRPIKLEEMISMAKLLSKDFDFARIDLYLIEDKIYFGEITLTPGGGFQKFSEYEYDLYLGSLLKLN
jgi:hypothetical protein